MKKTTSIFNLGLEFKALQDLADDIEFDNVTGEIINNDAEFNELYDELSMNVSDKLNGIMYIIKEKQASADTIATEIKRLQARKKAFENGADRLKQRLFEFIQLQDGKKFKTDLHSFSVRKSESVNIVSTDNIAREYFKIEKKPILSELKKALKDGVEIDGVEIKTNYSLSIK